MFDATVSFLEGNALAWLADRSVPHRIGSHHPNIAPFGAFAAADGQIVVCVGNDALFVAFAAALGAPELAQDPQFAQNAARSANRLVLTAVIEELLAADTCATGWRAWRRRRCPAPGERHRAGDGGRADRARRMRITAGGLELPGQVVKMAGYPDPVVRPAAPELDEHGDAIRAEFGL